MNVIELTYNERKIAISYGYFYRTEQKILGMYRLISNLDKFNFQILSFIFISPIILSVNSVIVMKNSLKLFI